MASFRRVNLEPWVVAIAVAGLVAYYALRNGTYDLVARGEMGLLAWTALGLGWATGVLPRERPSRAAWPVVAGFLALAIWTTICLRWTESDERTVVELGRVVHHAGVFLLAISLLSRRTWTAALGGLTAGLALVMWLGLCNWLWPGSIAEDHAREVLSIQRLTYPLDYFNGMATLGAMAGVAALGFAVHARHWALRALAVAPVPGIVVATYLTYSRGGAAELAAGLVVLLACARSRIPLLVVGLAVAAGSAVGILELRGHQNLVEGTGSAGAGTVLLITVIAGAVSAAVAVALSLGRADERLRLPRRIGRPALAAAGLVAIVALAVLGPALVREAGDSFRGQGVNDAANPTVRFTSLGSARQPQFDAALDAWKDHPVEGTGPGTYEFVWNRDPQYYSFVRDAHSLYLESLAESGIPGLAATLLALLGMAAIALLATLRARSGPERGAAAVGAGVLGVFLVAAGVDWAWELTALPVVAFVAAGALAVTLGGGRYRRALRPSRVAIPVAAVLALVALLPPIVSRSEIRESQAAAAAERPDDALRLADAAIDAAPWSATAMAQKSLVLEESGDLAEAEGYAVLAADREPTNWRYALLRSRLRAARGDVEGALRFFRLARTLAPRNPILR